MKQITSRGIFKYIFVILCIFRHTNYVISVQKGYNPNQDGKPISNYNDYDDYSEDYVDIQRRRGTIMNTK